MALVDGKRHDVPDVLDWIQVWGTGRPVHSINAFIMQELLTFFSHMRLSIVMHQKKPRAHCISIWSPLMAVRVQSGYHMEGCAALQRNASPHHY